MFVSQRFCGEKIDERMTDGRMAAMNPNPTSTNPNSAAANQFLMTNAEFVDAVNARFGDRSPCLRESSVFRDMEGIFAAAFSKIAEMMDIEPYTLLLTRIDDDQLASFLRFFVASVRRSGQVERRIIDTFTTAITRPHRSTGNVRVNDQIASLIPPLSSDMESQIAFMLCIQHYFS